MSFIDVDWLHLWHWVCEFSKWHSIRCSLLNWIGLIPVFSGCSKRINVIMNDAINNLKYFKNRTPNEFIQQWSSNMNDARAMLRLDWEYQQRNRFGEWAIWAGWHRSNNVQSTMLVWCRKKNTNGVFVSFIHFDQSLQFQVLSLTIMWWQQSTSINFWIDLKQLHRICSLRIAQVWIQPTRMLSTKCFFAGKYGSNKCKWFTYDFARKK